MNKMPYLALIALTSFGCTHQSTPVDTAKLFAAQTERKYSRIPSGDIYEFHGETWFSISDGSAHYQTPPTYFLEYPKTSKTMRVILPGAVESKQGLPTTKLLELMGPPDYITADKKHWVYWITDGGSLLHKR